jgi:hypothetical protein
MLKGQHLFARIKAARLYVGKAREALQTIKVGLMIRLQEAFSRR